MLYDFMCNNMFRVIDNIYSNVGITNDSYLSSDMVMLLKIMDFLYKKYESFREFSK